MFAVEQREQGRELVRSREHGEVTSDELSRFHREELRYAAIEPDAVEEPIVERRNERTRRAQSAIEYLIADGPGLSAKGGDGLGRRVGCAIMEEGSPRRLSVGPSARVTRTGRKTVVPSWREHPSVIAPLIAQAHAGSRHEGRQINEPTSSDPLDERLKQYACQRMSNHEWSAVLRRARRDRCSEVVLEACAWVTDRQLWSGRSQAMSRQGFDDGQPAPRSAPGTVEKEHVGPTYRPAQGRPRSMGSLGVTPRGAPHDSNRRASATARSPRTPGTQPCGFPAGFTRTRPDPRNDADPRRRDRPNPPTPGASSAAPRADTTCLTAFPCAGAEAGSTINAARSAHTGRSRHLPRAPRASPTQVASAAA